jgi:hypothetical protein
MVEQFIKTSNIYEDGILGEKIMRLIENNKYTIIKTGIDNCNYIKKYYGHVLNDPYEFTYSGSALITDITLINKIDFYKADIIEYTIELKEPNLLFRIRQFLNN